MLTLYDTAPVYSRTVPLPPKKQVNQQHLPEFWMRLRKLPFASFVRINRLQAICCYYSQHSRHRPRRHMHILRKRIGLGMSFREIHGIY